jgi:hypothetical protein
MAACPAPLPTCGVRPDLARVGGSHREGQPIVRPGPSPASEHVPYIGDMSEIPLGEASEEVAAAKLDAEAEAEAKLDVEAQAETELDPEAEAEL